MYDVFFGHHAAWFTIPAVLGTLVFVFQLSLNLIGAGVEGLDLDVDTDHIDPGFDVDHTDSTHVFKVISIQSMAAFMMGFGWGALAAYKGSELSIGIAILVGVGAGLGMMWILGMMLRAVHELQASGNVSLTDTVGVEGTVYVGIPETGAGRGQVTLVVSGKQRTFNAVSVGEAIPSRASVRVIKVNADNTLTVAPA